MEQELITARLRLRPIRRSDAPRLQALCNNWNVARMLSRVPYPSSVEVVEAWTGAQAAAWQSGSTYNFVITHPDGLIGVVGVSRRDEGDPGGDFEIGYWLGEPWWGQGLMTEAVGRVVDFTRAALGLDRLRSDYFADNPASGRVQKKCGFRITGGGRLNSLSRGCEVDAVFTELDLSAAGPGPDTGRNPDGAGS
jgi:8-oxo-dGTP diphosphatase